MKDKDITQYCIKEGEDPVKVPKNCHTSAHYKWVPRGIKTVVVIEKVVSKKYLVCLFMKIWINNNCLIHPLEDFRIKHQ